MTIEGSIYGKSFVVPDGDKLSLRKFSQLTGVDRYVLIKTLRGVLQASPSSTRTNVLWSIPEQTFLSAIEKVLERQQPAWGQHVDVTKNFHIERSDKKGTIIFDYRYPSK